MKIYAISDLYLSGEETKKPKNVFGSYVKGYIEEVNKNWDETVDDDDIVLISGGINWSKDLKYAKPDLDFIGKLKGKKIIIHGTHDYWWRSISAVRAALKEGTYALQNDCIRMDGVVICGSRGLMVPEPSEKIPAHEKKRSFKEHLVLDLSLKTANANRQDGDKLIVMLHYPPFNSKLEDGDFINIFNEYKVDKVVYGHLHGEKIQTPLYCVKDNVEYYLTSCDKVNNKLVRVL